MILEIPLTPQQQRFSIQLASITYLMVMKWVNVDIGGWTLDIYPSDAVPGTDEPIVGGIPLVTGTDLLDQYGYLNFGGSLVVQSDEKPAAVPTYTNLGLTSHLYFLTDVDAAAYLGVS